MKKNLLFSFVLLFAMLTSWAQTTPPDWKFAFSGGTITGYNAFGEVNIIIPNTIGGVTVVAIGDYAFNNKGLTGVVLPNTLVTIGTAAFNSNQLSTVVIPSSVTTIGDMAFDQNQLTSVTLGSGLLVIGNQAFAGAMSLTNGNRITSIEIPPSVTTIGSYAFSGNQLTSVVIPASVTALGTPDPYGNSAESAFSHNKLTSVVFEGTNLTSIPTNTFYDNQLTKIEIPFSVTSISQSGFRLNPQLKDITIGANVTLGNFAFTFVENSNNGFATLYNVNKQAGRYQYISGAWQKTSSYWFVATTGSDANPGTPAQPKLTIQAAINAAAAAGDVISVAAGTYTEQLNITKGLTLIGDVSNPDNVIIDGENKTILASTGQVRIYNPTGDVVFKGFKLINGGAPSTGGNYYILTKGSFSKTIQNCKIIGHGAGLDAGEDYGIWAYTGAGDLIIKNSYFTDMYHAILIEKITGALTIESNTFDNLYAPYYAPYSGSVGGRAIEAITYGGTNITTLQKVTGNTFTNFKSTGIIFSGGFSGSGVGKYTNVVIDNNNFSFDASDIVNGYGAINLRNVSTSNSDPLGGVTADIHDNTFSVPSTSAIQISGLNGAITCSNNSISGSPYGINADAALATPITATCNYWGTADASEVAAKIIGTVTYIPYSVSDGGACVGGMPVVVKNGSTIVAGYSTIQAAIDASSTLGGYVIEVAPGTYNELITINKGISLVSTGGRDVTFISTPFGTLTTGVRITAINLGIVTIDGFTVKDFTEGGIIQPMAMSTGTAFKVYNCKVMPYSSYLRNGIQVSGDGSEVIGNYVVGASLTADWAGTGIHVVNASNVLVKGNTVNSGHADYGIVVDNYSATLVNNITIEDNTVDGAKYAAVCIQGPNATSHKVISDIVIQNNVFKNGQSDGIDVYYCDLTNLTIMGNQIYNNTYDGIWFHDLGTVLAGNMLINNNQIYDNAQYGINNVNTYNIDATCNWYGTADYNLIPTKVSGNVSFMPYLVTADIVSPVCSGGIWPVHNVTQSLYYQTIQTAVTEATAGDLIEVAAGTYTENVVIGNSITLQGADRETTFIDGSNTGVVVTIAADNVTLEGFSIQNSGADLEANAGVVLANVTGCTVINNYIINNVNGVVFMGSTVNSVQDNWINNNVRYGIFVGIFGVSNASSNNTISGNVITDSGRDGIYVDKESNSNTIQSNTISSTNGTIEDGDFEGNGIYLWKAGSNTVSGNTIDENAGNGIEISAASNNVITLNMITGNAFNGIAIRATTVVASTGNSVTFNDVYFNTLAGILLKSDAAANSGTITDNYIAQGGMGINVETASINAASWTVEHNSITDNTSYGVVNNGTGTLTAACNWWGTTDYNSILASVSGNVDFVSYLANGDIGAPDCSGGVWPVHNLTQSLYYQTIQSAITAATAGDVIEVAAGTYAENVTVDKRITLDGAGSGTDGTVISVSSGSAITVTGSGSDVSNRLVIKDVRVTGGASSGIYVTNATSSSFLTFDNIYALSNTDGISFAGTGTVTDAIISNSFLSNNVNNGLRIASACPSFIGLTVSNCEMNTNGWQAFSYNASGTNNIGTDFNFTNCSFTNNCSSNANSGGLHDLSFFGFKGNATLTNITVVANHTANGHGVVFTPQPLTAPAGNITINGMTVSGSVPKSGLYFGTYTDLSNVSLNNVDVSSVSSGNRSGWAGTPQFVVESPSSNAFNIGNTTFKTLGVWSASPVNATSAIFKHITTGVTLDRSTLADCFQIEDQVGHATDAAGLGLARVKADNIYVTPSSAKIQRGIDAATATNTVNVAAGTYPESLTIGKSLTLLGPNATQTPNSGTRADEAILAPTTGADAITASADGITVVFKGFKLDMSNAASTSQMFYSATSNSTWTFEHNIYTNFIGEDYAQWWITGSHTNFNFNLRDCFFTANTSISNGIMMDAPGYTPTVSILDNVWLDNKGYQMNLNSVHGTISGNTIKNTTVPSDQSGGIILAASNTNVTIQNNTFEKLNRPGILTYPSTSFAGTLTVNGNMFKDLATGNRGAFYVGTGSTVSGITLNNNAFINNDLNVNNYIATSFDASCNWWDATAQSAIAAKLYGPVSYSAWLVDGTNEATGAGFFQSTPNCAGTPVVVTLNTLTNVSCPGTATGAINVDVSGGSGNYSFLWSNVQNTEDITALVANTYTITVTDVTYGSTSIFSQEVTTTNTIPAVTNPGNQTAYTATGTCANVVTYTATPSGTPLPTLTYEFTGVTTGSGSGSGSGSTFNKGITNVTVTASNGCSPDATAEFTVTVTDNENPTISCVGNQAKNVVTGTCTYVAGATEFNPTSFADNCPGAGIAYALTGATTGTGTNLSGVNFNKGITTVVWTVTDAVSNSANCSFTVTVTDPTNATALYVNDGSLTGDTYTYGIGNDVTGDGSKCSPYATITKAIAVASTGGTIYVDAGTYAESVTITKGLDIRGANYGVNPNTGGRGAESVFASASGMNLYVNTTASVQIDGFKFANTGGAYDHSLSGTTGTTISLSNNFWSNSIGGYLPNAVSTTIVNNRLTFSSGADEGFALFGNYNGTTGTVIDVHDNVWLTGQMTGMNINACSGSIYNNVFDGIAYYGVLLAGNTNISIYQNEFKNIVNPNPAKPEWGSGVRFYPSFTGTSTVHNNSFTSNYRGMVMQSGATLTNVDVHDNSFVGNTTNAILNQSTGVLNATCNWWDATAQSAIAAKLNGLVSYTPWLIDGTDSEPATPGFQAVPGSCMGSSLAVSLNYKIDAGCPGTNTGSIYITVGGGSGSYTYLWSNGGYTTKNITGIPAGSYNVLVSDAIYGSTGELSSPVVIGTTNTAPQVSNPGAITASTALNTCAGPATYLADPSGTPLPTLSYTFSGATTGSGSGTGSGSTFNKGVTTVTVTANNGCTTNSGSTATFTVTVNDNQAPSITSCPGNQAKTTTGSGYTAVGSEFNPTFSDNCPGSTIAYVLSGATTATGNTTLAGVVFNSGTTTVAWTVTDDAGKYNTSCSFDVVVSVSFTISGTLKYANNAQTPLNGIIVTLKKTSAPSPPVGTWNTSDPGQSGTYQFTGLQPDNYFIELSPAVPQVNVPATLGGWKTWGGVNATDYLIEQRHASGITPIPLTPAVKRLGGDVIVPQPTPTILIVDANAVKTAYSTNSPAGFANQKWLFSASNAVSPATGLTGIILGSANLTINIVAACAGDVDASYQPPSGNKAAQLPNVNVISRGSIAASDEMIIPVSAESSMQMGAISLILDFDATNFDIIGISMPDQGDGDPFFVTDNNMLRIGWASLTPVEVLQGETVLNIHARAKGTASKSLRFTLNSDPLSEIADAEGVVFKDALLAIAEVDGNTKDVVSVYPNPAKDVLNIGYAMQADGTFFTELYSVQGSLVMATSANDKLAGSYTETLNTSKLTPGIYTLRIYRGSLVSNHKIIVTK